MPHKIGLYVAVRNQGTWDRVRKETISGNASEWMFEAARMRLAVEVGDLTITESALRQIIREELAALSFAPQAVEVEIDSDQNTNEVAELLGGIDFGT